MVHLHHKSTRVPPKDLGGQSYPSLAGETMSPARLAPTKIGQPTAIGEGALCGAEPPQ